MFLALARADRILTRMERWLVTIAAVLNLIIMAVIVSDVVLRYFFHSPLIWATELIGWYLMVLVFYAALSGAFSHQSHIRVDILRARTSKRVQRLMEIVTCATAALAFCLIAQLAAARAWESFQGKEVMSGIINWPSWPPPAFVALGAAIIALRLTLNTVAVLVNALGGPEIVELPAASGAHVAEDFSE